MAEKDDYCEYKLKWVCVRVVWKVTMCVCVHEDKVLHECISINLRSVKESPSLTEIMYMIFLDAVFHRNVTKHK